MLFKPEHQATDVGSHLPSLSRAVLAGVVLVLLWQRHVGIPREVRHMLHSGELRDDVRVSVLFRPNAANEKNYVETAWFHTRSLHVDNVTHLRHGLLEALCRPFFPPDFICCGAVHGTRVVHPVLRSPRPTRCWEGDEEVVLLVLHRVIDPVVLSVDEHHRHEHFGILMPGPRVVLIKVCRIRERSFNHACQQRPGVLERVAWHAERRVLAQHCARTPFKLSMMSWQPDLV